MAERRTVVSFAEIAAWCSRNDHELECDDGSGVLSCYCGQRRAAASEGSEGKQR